MIGFYDYTIILTLLSVVSAICGMTQAMEGHFRLAVFFLALCGFFDTFDGKVARTKKGRTEAEKTYGIQLDSLADVVAFGIFPTMICYVMGMHKWYDMIILCFFGICGVIRLAYFNVLEMERQLHPTGEEKVFHGLPITSISIFLPVIFLISFVTSEATFTIILRVVMLLVGTLFILDFKVHKPKNWHIAVLCLIVGCASLTILLFSRYKLPHKPEPETPLIEVEEFNELIEEFSE